MNKSTPNGDLLGQGLKRSEQRHLAKAGMIASLGTLVVTGFFRFKGSWMLHTWAGVFLVGFSLWHHFLNQPRRVQPDKAQSPAVMNTGTRRATKTGR
jgi:hypothetical protein